MKLFCYTCFDLWDSGVRCIMGCLICNAIRIWKGVACLRDNSFVFIAV